MTTRYDVTLVSPHPAALAEEDTPPWARRGVTLSGETLGTVGVQAPFLRVDTMAVIRARALDA